MAQQSQTMLIALLVVGLVIGGGIGYFAAPKGTGETEYIETTVEVHPLKGKTLKIGVTASSTSGLETSVPLMDDIVTPDVNEFMDQLGLDITFEWLLEDNEGTAAIALEKTQTFKAMGINIVQGHGWSSQCSAALSYVNENDMILVSSSSTSPILAIADDMLFRTCPTDFVQAPALAEMWYTWGVKGVLTMHRADTWGDGLWNIFKPEIEKRGLDNLGRIRYAGEVTEFSSYLDEANQIVTAAIEEYGGPEYVGMQFYSFAELRTITVQAADYPNLLSIEWFTTEAYGRSEATLREAGEYAVQIHHISSFMGVDEGSVEFLSLDDRYYDMTSYKAGFYTAAQYDANWLIVKNILETGSMDASDMAKVIIPMSYKHHGTSGWLQLDENGDRAEQTFDLWGLYEDPDTGEYTFRKFGQYDGKLIIVDWYDEDIEYYMGKSRPGA